MTLQHFQPRFSKIIIGIIAICIPVGIGFIIWPEIKASLQTTYVYYKVDEKYYKIHINKHKEFETDMPDAKICVSYNGEDYEVPINLKDEMIKKYGANNITLTVLDRNNDVIRKQSSIHRVPGY
jgi:uncharacterized protein YxeA